MPFSSHSARSPFKHWSGNGRMPPSPCTGSIRIAPTAVVDRRMKRIMVAPADMSEARQGSARTLWSSSPTPAAAIPAEERPWNDPSKARIVVFSGWPLSYQYLRAIFTANSQDSVPELVKNTVSANVLADQLVGKRLLLRDLVQVRHMPQLCAWSVSACTSCWMRMAQRIHGNAGPHIKKASPVRLDQPSAFALHEVKRRTGIGRQDGRDHGKPRFKKPKPCQAARAKSTERSDEFRQKVTDRPQSRA